MSFKVSISNDITLEKCILSVSINVDPPPDDFKDLRINTITSMTITGRIGTDEDVLGLNEWAMIPANDPKCYKETTYTNLIQIYLK